MKQKYPKIAFVSFMLGYLFGYYLILWLGNTIFSARVADSMALLGAYETKLKIALLVAPIVAALFGTFAASILITSYTAMGSDRMGSTRFFMTGWVSFCVSNMLVISGALQLLVDRAVGLRWIQQIGQVRFNAWFFLLAPTLGFIAGILINVLVNQIIEAQDR